MELEIELSQLKFEVASLQAQLDDVKNNNIVDDMIARIDDTEVTTDEDGVPEEPFHVHEYDDAEDFPWEKVNLSCRITSTNKITVVGGNVWVGENSPIIFAGGEYTITVDDQYVILIINLDDMTLGVNVSTTLANSSSPYFVFPLCKTSYDGTNAAITAYMHLGGDVHLPGTWAQ